MQTAITNPDTRDAMYFQGNCPSNDVENNYREKS
jgi:hypothetical protein